MPESDRVRRNTPSSVLQRIDRQLEESVRFHAAGGGLGIHRRLKELDREADIESHLELTSSLNGLLGVVLALTHNPRWLALTAVSLGFLAQHALQGWCPPLSLFRRLGVRTRQEIERERYALKAARGDFRTIAFETGNQRLRATRALQAVEA
jgi:hypothetical protein